MAAKIITRCEDPIYVDNATGWNVNEDGSLDIFTGFGNKHMTLSVGFWFYVEKVSRPEKERK